MNLPEFSVTRPVTVIMIVVAILILGAISIALLPQELFPQIVYPQLTVVSPYENAAPEEIETLITRPIEEAVGTVAGVKRISSISKEGLSLVMAEFSWNQNINFAALGMREKLDLIKERLPREAEEPIVLAFNPFDKPILTLSITSSGDRTPLKLRELAKRMIKDEIEKVDGVAAANISGGLEREIYVDIDQNKLQRAEITLLDITKSISNANLNYPAGTIKESFYEYLIRTLGEFERVSEINDVVIGNEDPDEERTRENQVNEEDLRRRGRISQNNRLIFLKDIATITDDVKERTSYSRYNGTENISIQVQKQSLGNTVKVIDRVKKKLKEIEGDLPKDIEIAVVYDQSTFIKEAINGVWEAGWQGALLVIIVLLYFLRNIATSVIVTLTIPVSVMATFALMYFSGISINMMSLGGITFGIGNLVDNSVVVLENIFRHMQQGADRKKAAIVATDEVFISVVGSTLTTVVVFIPLTFVIGLMGQITKDFALTVAYAQVVSLIVGMTLIPLLASKFVKVMPAAFVEDKEGNTTAAKGDVTPFLRRIFSGLLKKFLNQKGRHLFLTTVLFLISLAVFAMLDKEMMPKVDQGQFTMKANMRTGTKLEVTNRVCERIEKYLLTSIPEIDSVNVTVGSTKESSTRAVAERLGAHQAEILIGLKKKRERSSSDIVQEVKSALVSMSLEGARIEYILQENVFATGLEGTAPVTIEIKGNKLDVLEKLVKDVSEGLGKIDSLYGIKNSMTEPSPETKIIVDKDKSSLYNLSVVDIAQTAQVALKGYVATKFKEKGEEFDVLVRLQSKDRDTFEKVRRIEVRSQTGAIIPLSSVADFTRGLGPSEIRRVNQQRTVYVYANVYNRPMKEVNDDVTAMLKNLGISKDYFVKLAGESEEMKASFDSMRGAIIAAFLMVYMVMAALFESLWQPFIIMFSIPLSLIGISGILILTHTSVSAYVLMGIGMLAGIVVNNAIVLIDCINLFLSRGMSLRQALATASDIRLRPILMTASSTVLGLVPMAFLGGEGAELRAPLAITVIGGLTVSTFLTLVVIPSIYLGYIDVVGAIFKRKKKESPKSGG